jgi:hypothetical protein
MLSDLLIIERNAYILLLTYVAIVIIQMYIVRKYIINWQSLITGDNQDNMSFNISHKSELNAAFSKNIKQRIKRLHDTSYKKWLAYNNKYSQYQFQNDHTYNVYIYERVPNELGNYNNTSRFILRSSPVKESLNLAYEDILREIKYTFNFSVFRPNDELIDTIYQGIREPGETREYSYYSVDNQINRAVKINATTGVWEKKNKDGSIVDGVIIIGYPLLDVEQQYANKYYDFLDDWFIRAISIGSIIVAFLLYYASKKRHFFSAMAFLVLVNTYLTIFINTTEGITDLASEQAKVTDINDGILSISFLAAVNIFILQTIKRKNVSSSYSLHSETAFLFATGLLLLLFALYKQTNYNTIDDIRVHRIQKQVMYNLSIFVNMFILINYVFYVTYKSKAYDRIVRSIMQ